MKTSFTKLFARALLLLALSTFNFQLSTFAQGTAFTYQGRLTSGTNAATGIFDLRFAIYDAVTVGTQQGNLLTNSATAVTNGLFAVTLDFGNQFPGANRWLEIAVRTNGAGVFTNLAPRQKLTPTPYAIYAVSAATAASASSVAAANITGIIPAAQLPATVVTNGASGVNFSGTFSGSGAGMTNLNLAANSGGAVIPSGTFVLTATVSAGVNSGPEAVTAADVNGDGKPDIIVADFDSKDRKSVV